MTFQEMFEQLKAQQAEKKPVVKPANEAFKNFQLENLQKFLENFRNRSDDNGSEDK